MALHIRQDCKLTSCVFVALCLARIELGQALIGGRKYVQ